MKNEVCSITLANSSPQNNWLPGGDVFAADRLFFPINVGNFHWTLIVVTFADRSIRYYDSARVEGELFHPNVVEREHKYLNAVLDWLKDEHRTKKRSALPHETEWRTYRTPKGTPQQDIGTCGRVKENKKYILLTTVSAPTVSHSRRRQNQMTAECSCLSSRCYWE